MRRGRILLVAGLLAACRGPAEAPAPVATKATPVEAAPAKETPPTPADAPLPPSDRVFVAPLVDGVDHVLGADGDGLWAARPTKDGRGVVRWRIKGPGVVQRIAMGDLGQGPRLFIAWGMGRGFLGAPLVVHAADPATGALTELWRTTGERNEAATLG
ncbi:MAG: hypothetical protein KC620_01775, partial [Myxococcales bacterium]|nr:hypothetical protein [Myxococcales bacterium]